LNDLAIRLHETSRGLPGTVELLVIITMRVVCLGAGERESNDS